MTVDPFTAADPAFQRAITLGNRDRLIPIVPSRDGIGGLAKTLAGGAVFFFFVGFLCRIIWII